MVYGVEDRRHFLAHVPELDGEAVAQGAPRVAVGAGEGVEGLDGAQGVGVALVRLVEQAVPLRGVVPHTGQGAADLTERLVVELAGAVALHQAAGLAEPRRGLVEVDLAALAGAVGQVVQLDVLDAALEAVQRVTGQGVGTGGGDAAERSRGHTDAEPARGETLRQP